MTYAPYGPRRARGQPSRDGGAGALGGRTIPGGKRPQTSLGLSGGIPFPVEAAPPQVPVPFQGIPPPRDGSFPKPL